MPLVADIHFQPQVAMMVADAFEKIRVNPGNFADGRKTFEVINYDDPAQFRAEQEEIREVCCHTLGTCNLYLTLCIPYPLRSEWDIQHIPRAKLPTKPQHCI